MFSFVKKLIVSVSLLSLFLTQSFAEENKESQIIYQINPLSRFGLSDNSIESIREKFNEFFRAGKYDQAEDFLKSVVLNSSHSSEAAKILESFRKFRNSDDTREIAFLVYNPLSVTVNYQLRWGEGEWQTLTLKPFKSWRHSSPVNRDNTYGIGKPQIRLRKTNSTDAITFNVKSTIVSKGSNEGLAFNYIAKDDDSENYSVYSKKNDSDFTAVVTIQNTTKINLNFSWKWDVEDSQWNQKTLGPGEKCAWSWEYRTSKLNISPNFLIRFDSDLSSENSFKLYKLKRKPVLRSEVGSSFTRNFGQEYFFQVHGYSVLDLHSK